MNIEHMENREFFKFDSKTNKVEITLSYDVKPGEQIVCCYEPSWNAIKEVIVAGIEERIFKLKNILTKDVLTDENKIFTDYAIYSPATENIFYFDEISSLEKLKKSVEISQGFDQFIRKIGFEESVCIGYMIIAIACMNHEKIDDKLYMYIISKISFV